MSITFPIGFRAAAATAGLKPSGKPDLALIVRDAAHARTASFAASFTTNQIVGAPVVVGRDLRARVLNGTLPAPAAVLVNAGNSNAATGERGIADARRCMQLVADRLHIHPEAVVPCSTGVIGRPLPVDKIAAKTASLAASLAAGDNADADAARAIMTTDLVPKSAKRTVTLSTGTVRLGAIAKGSGMIAPRLDSAAAPPTPSATMLAFVTIDARLTSRDLQHALDRAVATSFNRISVDNHPSCSDTVLCLGSGAGPVVSTERDAVAFAAALADLCRELAERVVTDGEGATRVFRVDVAGAPSDAAAERMAREVVNSPLVKCAIHGRDPNWGRVVTAAGNAGVPIDASASSLTIGEVEVYRAGVPVVEALTDPRLKSAMNAPRVELRLRVGHGPGHASMLGCDLSKDYIAINADYTT